MIAEHRGSVILPPDQAEIGFAPPIDAPITTTPIEPTAPRSTGATPSPSVMGSTMHQTYGSATSPDADRDAAAAAGAADRPGRRPRHAGQREFLDGLEPLVVAARSGQPGAMTELIRRFTPLVRAVVRRAGIYGAEAEDVEQETWLRLATNLDRVREPTALPRWLSVTAGRLCTSLFDKRRRVQPAGDFSEDVWPSGERLADPADLVCLRDEVVRLYDAIDTLGPRDRTLVKLLMEATPYREISATIAMPVGSIGPTRERVLRKLAGSAPLRSTATAPARPLAVPVAAA